MLMNRSSVAVDFIPSMFFYCKPCFHFIFCTKLLTGSLKIMQTELISNSRVSPKDSTITKCIFQFTQQS